jgi:prophage regulatory protein
MSDSLMSIRDILDVVPVSRNTIERMVKEGRFPKPVPISLNRRGWYRSEVDAWMESLRDKDDKTQTADEN